ncbi:GntR family transcriptional regulator [Xanthobacter autotrophicus DSM 431]|uniref:GntR family transcriptional regulator n=1 Tax=Xanthobacter nonsaccharivorans TaxID=3119912 RepID=UPI00372BD772
MAKIPAGRIPAGKTPVKRQKRQVAFASAGDDLDLLLAEGRVRAGAEARKPPVRRTRKAETPEVAEDASLTDRAYRILEELIATLQLPPGAVLSELALSDRLKIGRTPIREALQRLARDGLVVVLPRRGVLVSEINLRTQLRLLEVRRVIETLMAGLAAERATAEEREGFAEVASAMRQAAEVEDDLAFMRLDRRFNLLMAQASRNEFAVRSMGLMNALSRRFWYQHYREVADLPLAARLHAEVAEAVARRDPRGAEAAAMRLVDYIEDFARKTLDA